MVVVGNNDFLSNTGDALCCEPQNDQLIGIVLLFATKKAKQQSLDLFHVNEKLTNAW